MRGSLTYANVMSTLLVFLALGGATAFAATQLGKNSVGTKQLKKNAVTAAKIKKNAVTKAKIKNGSVNSAKLLDGSVTGTDINLGSTPFSRIVAKLRGSGSVSVPAAEETITVYPLASSTYTQGAEELNSYAGAIDVTFAPTCGAPRQVIAYVLVDSKDPTKPKLAEVAAAGGFEDETGATSSRKVEAGPYIYGGTKFEPGADRARTVSLVVVGGCKTGGGITLANGAVDVIGTK